MKNIPKLSASIALTGKWVFFYTAYKNNHKMNFQNHTCSGKVSFNAHCAWEIEDCGKISNSFYVFKRPSTQNRGRKFLFILSLKNYLRLPEFHHGNRYFNCQNRVGFLYSTSTATFCLGWIVSGSLKNFYPGKVIYIVFSHVN